MQSPSIDRLQERFGILQARYGYQLLDAESYGEFAKAPGNTLILFADDPAKVPETWDLTIILPEAVKAMSGLRVGLLAPDAARRLAPRYGITLWPALLVLRDGEFLGAIEGLKDWAVYRERIPALLAGPASRPPGIGIPVRTVGMASGTCH